MNKSLKFFAISLLFVSALRAGDSYSSKAMAAFGWVASHSKQVGIGALSGAATTLGFKAGEKVLGLTERTKDLNLFGQTEKVEFVLAQGANGWVADRVNGFLSQNSDELDAMTLMERTAGNFLGVQLAKMLLSQAK